MRVSFSDLSFGVDFVHGEVTRALEVAIGSERFPIEAIDGGSVLLRNVAVAHELANDPRPRLFPLTLGMNAVHTNETLIAIYVHGSFNSFCTPSLSGVNHSDVSRDIAAIRTARRF